MEHLRKPLTPLSDFDNSPFFPRCWNLYTYIKNYFLYHNYIAVFKETFFFLDVMKRTWWDCIFSTDCWCHVRMFHRPPLPALHCSTTVKLAWTKKKKMKKQQCRRKRENKGIKSVALSYTHRKLKWHRWQSKSEKSYIVRRNSVENLWWLLKKKLISGYIMEIKYLLISIIFVKPSDFKNVQFVYQTSLLNHILWW